LIFRKNRKNPTFKSTDLSRVGFFNIYILFENYIKEIEKYRVLNSTLVVIIF